MVIPVLIFTFGFAFLGWFSLSHEKEKMIRSFNNGKCNVYCIENDTKGRYRRGDVGVTVGIVTEDEKVPVEINNILMLIPVKHLRLIINDRQQ